MSIVFECNQWNGGGSILGSGRRMTYTVAVNPDSGSTNAGYDSATMVTVTSTNGVQVGDITFKLDGLEGLGTEAPPLSDATCTFNSPLQPGSTCSFILDISTYNTDPLGTYTLTILASSQGTTGASAQYALTISSPVAPSPVIVSPTDGASFAVNQPFTLIGYARTTAAGAFVGSVPCSQMQFQVTAPDGSTQSYTPTEDQSYPQTGYCDSPQISFSVQGVASITLTASDNGITGTSQVVSVNVVSQQQQQTNPFSFSLGASAQSGALNAYSVSSATFTIQVTISGTPQPVQLSVSGLPSDVTYSFSANPVTPTGSIGTSTLTITTSDATAEGTYTLTISGMAGGITESTTVTLQIVKLA